MIRSRRPRRRNGLRRLLAAGALAVVALMNTAPPAAAWEPICVTASPPAGWTEETEGPTTDGYTRSWGYSGNDTDGPGGTYREYEARVGFEQAAYTSSQGPITTLQEFLDEFEETQQAASEEVVVRGNGTTTLGGRSAFYTSWTRRWSGYETTNTGVGIKMTYQEEAIHLVDLGDSAVAVAVTSTISYWGTGVAATPSPDAEALVAELFRRGTATLEGMTFDWDGCAAGPGTPPAQPLPWATVVSGAAAVLAAAAAMAGTAAGRTGRKQTVDPNRPVGYVLDLSAARIDLSAGPADLGIQVWTVLGSGRIEPAAAQVTLQPPPGVEASVLVGAAPLRAVLRQVGPVAPGASLQVAAATAEGATSAAVPLVALPPVELAVVTVPPGATLRPQGGRALLVRAELRLPPGASADLEPVRASITFDPPAADGWLDTGQPRDVPGGKELPVALSSPDPTRTLTPPDTVVVIARAALGAGWLVGSVTIPVERPPVLDLRPDTLQVAAGSAVVTDVLAWVAEPGPGPWAFAAHWREGDRPVALVEIRPQTESTALVRVTEDAARLPDPGVAEEAATLVVTAAADGWDTLARHLRVIVAREGLFLDPVDRDAEGVLHLDATGAGRPTLVDARVYAREASGQIVLDEGRSASLDWTPGGGDPSPGRAALGFPEFTVEFTGMRPGNRPAATYRLVMGRRLPTSGEPIPAILDAAAGTDEPNFVKPLALALDGVDMSPFSPVWQEEQAECLRIIDAYAPRDRQAHLRALVYERGPKIGAEALHELRRRIWSLSENALRAEAADYLTKAWTYEQAEGVLDWASWCGDIALSVVSGRITGTAAGIAVGLLKPVLVSAINAYLDGKSLEDWGREQVMLAVSVAEGQFTDPDFLEKMSGASRAKVWAVFIAYTFCKEWYLDPEHRITEAALNTVRMLRDQALIHFLRKGAGTLPQTPPPGEQDAASKKKDATKPDADATPPPPKRPGTPQSRAEGMAAEIRAKAAAGKPLDRGAVLEILRDPDAMRSLKKNHPDEWRVYTDQRQRVYDAHDARLKEWIAAHPETFPKIPGRTVEVEFFGTKTGVDRDYRVGYTHLDVSVQPPRKVFIEIKKELWTEASQRIFAEETGGPTDPQGAAKWAKDHQQLATDQYHAEASVDMADQLRVWNPNAGEFGPDGKPKGGWEQVQVEPRVQMVEHGRGTLLDPDGLGKTYETKVAEAYHEGNTVDAYTQAGKAVHTLEAVRDGYAQQGYGIKDLPPKLQEGLDVVKRVNAGTLDPASAEAKLRDLEMGGLPGLMERLSGSFGSLRWARKP